MGYLGVPPQSGFITTSKQRLTSSTNNYVDLDHAISSLADVIVFVNFVKQDTTNLTLTTSTRITLGGTLVSSDIVEIHYLGKAVNTQTPATGTVTADALAGSIGLDKLSATGTKSSSTFLRGDNTFASAGFSITGAAAYPDGTQSMSDNTFTKVDLEVEDFDTNNEFSASRFTASAAGKYLVSGAVFENGEAGANVQHFASIYKNGSRFLDGGQTTDYGVNYTFNVPTTAVTLAQNDYLELYYFHNKGSALTINGLSTAIRSTHLTVLRII